MCPQADTWLIDPAADNYGKGFSAVLNEEAPSLDHSLFHYTTEAGLDGILRTGELWGSSIAFLDDPKEVQFGWTICSEIASGWAGPSLSFDRIIRLIPEFVEKDLKRERFVISFCSEPDYLLAWRAYAGDSHGYCLELSPDALKTTDGWYLAKVEYNEDEHRNEIHRLVKRLERAYLSVEKTPHQQFLTEQTLITAALWMSLVAPTFKDPRYESEQEWRLIRTRFGDGDQRAMTVAERLRAGEAVPYVARRIGSPGDSASAIKRILCGARVAESTVKDVRRLAKERFPGCEVVRSEILLRRRGG